MSNTIAVPDKTRASWTQLAKQLTEAKSIMRRMRQTVEDVEDARTIEQAKRAHGKKPRIPWSQVKKEAGLD
jgi:predicted transcriptional regulator